MALSREQVAKWVFPDVHRCLDEIREDVLALLPEETIGSEVVEVAAAGDEIDDLKGQLEEAQRINADLAAERDALAARVIEQEEQLQAHLDQVDPEVTK